MSVPRPVLFTCLILSLASGLGCTAVCVRDSDCMGASICSENRCILIVGADAGRSSVAPSDGEGTPSSPSTTPPDASRDAGAIR